MSLKRLLNDDDVESYRTQVSPPSWNDYGDYDSTEPSLSAQSWDQCFDELLVPFPLADDVAVPSSYETCFGLDVQASPYAQDQNEQCTNLLIDHEPMAKADYVCYGTICRASIKLSGNMLDLDRRLIAGTASPVTGHLQFQLQKTETQFLVAFADGHILGEVNAQLEKALTSIEEQHLQFEIEVFVPTRATRETISRAIRGNEAVVRVQLNIYGPRASSDSVGQELSQNKLYLQRPDYVRQGAVYENPHVLKFSDEQNATSIVNINADEPSSDGAYGEELQKVITDVYASLTRNENLKGLEGHERLRTPLLDHQRTALEFLSQRENGPIPEIYQLWKPAEREGQSCYRHVVTGAISGLEHTETGGVILADEMGMGKSLSMLALILRTLDMAHAWAVRTTTDAQGAQESWKLKGRCKATLIVASSDLMINEWFQELAKHFGSIDEHGLKTFKYHGQNRRCSVDKLRDTDIVITTYHTLASDYSNAKGLLNQVEWYRLVLDEGTSPVCLCATTTALKLT
ncbi:hypothetical protein EJ07DRAFT_109297 [Lizonia empirigonia]|nr:hypothetical protein EJ07DRAFT_109297 [Lizonia empirigonia]